VSTKTHTIEVDEATAATLNARAAQRGVSVADYIAELARLEGGISADERDQVGELERRWAAVEAGGPAVPHSEVVRWLRTWGTPDLKPWNARITGNCC
jgi:predicted transcriptional regulator